MPGGQTHAGSCNMRTLLNRIHRQIGRSLSKEQNNDQTNVHLEYLLYGVCAILTIIIFVKT